MGHIDIIILDISLSLCATERRRHEHLVRVTSPDRRDNLVSVTTKTGAENSSYSTVMTRCSVTHAASPQRMLAPDHRTRRSAGLSPKQSNGRHTRFMTCWNKTPPAITPRRKAIGHDTVSVTTMSRSA